MGGGGGGVKKCMTPIPAKSWIKRKEEEQRSTPRSNRRSRKGRKKETQGGVLRPKDWRKLDVGVRFEVRHLRG